MACRIDRLRKVMAENRIDAVMLTSEPNRRYATGFASTDGVAVITKIGAYFFTDSRYIEAAAEAIEGFEVLRSDISHSYSSLINEVLAESDAKTLGFEDMAITYSEYSSYKKSLTASLVPVGSAVSALREVKEPSEIEILIAAQRLAEKAFDELLCIINPEMTEKQVAAELVYRMRLLGADDVSFDPIVVSGSNSSKPHGVPSGRKLQRNSFTTIDFGCKLDGYCSDETRTIAFGGVSSEMRHVYDTVLKAQEAGISAAKAGVTGAEIHTAAANIISAAGYGEYFGHGFGHGVGLEIHEHPNASPSWKTPLKAGSVISAEPGIYLPGQFGVRIEDVIILTETGCIDITKTEKHLIVL